MAQTDNKTSLSSEEKRSLAESARLCEMIVEANPSDTGALETLKEIYTKLGDRENLARVVARLAGTVGGRPSASVAPAADARDRPARRRPRTWRRSPRPSRSRRPRCPASGAAPRRSSGARAACHASGTGWSPRSSSARTSSQRALAEQKGSADKLGTILVRLQFITEDSLVSFLSQAVRDARDHGGAGGSGPGRAQARPGADRQEAQRAPDQADRERAHPGDGGPHQRLRARRRRVHDRPADPAGGRLRGGHPQGLRAPLRDAAAASPT